MNGKRIHLYREVQNYSMFHQGETVIFQYERDGELHEATVTPELTNGSYKYGIGGNINYRQKTNVLETLEYSAYEVYYWIDTTVSSLGLLFKGGVQLDDMSGPVGVVDAIGTIVSGEPGRRCVLCVDESAEYCDSALGQSRCDESAADSGAGRRTPDVPDRRGDPPQACRAGAGSKDSFCRSDAAHAFDGGRDV